jgi:hypothetical protein
MVDIKHMHRCFLVNVSDDAVDTVLNQIWAKKFFRIDCAVEGCENRDIEMHHVDKINHLKDQFGNISVVTKKVDVSMASKLLSLVLIGSRFLYVRPINLT